MNKLMLWIVFCISTCGCPSYGEDSPCAARWSDEGQGYICVCNSSYCDTVTAPETLEQGYHLYKTSNSTPGFTRTSGNFTDLNVTDNTDFTFSINSSVEYQEIIGFGGSATDSALININYLPEEAQEKLIESYFGPSGIEYNMIRVPIGGTDFSIRDYTLDDTPFDEQLQNFSLAPEDYNLRIPMIKKAIALSKKEIKLLACTWTAPAWMKIDNTNFAGYISSKYFDVWAEYHIRFLDAYSKENLTLWSISGGNEGLLIVALKSLQTPTLNSTFEFVNIQRSWLKNQLKPRLEASGYGDVKFLALEDQRLFALYFMDRIARDPAAYKAVDGLALHWYSDFYITPSVLSDLHRLYPEKLILYTESSANGGFGPDPVSLGSWYRASGYLYNIFQNLEHWVSAYLDWNLVLNEDGTPSLSFGIEAPVIVNETSGEFYKQPMFYAMGHFSKFIQPGAKKLQVLASNNTALEEDISRSGKSAKESLRDFISFSKSRHGLMGNQSSFSLTIPAVVQCLAFSNPDNSVSVLVLNTMNKTVQVKVTDPRVGSVVLPVEEGSINTFVYWPKG